jgi:chromosomal replication initiator protein
LRQDFTFENFAVSSTNQMAHAAAIAVSKALGKAYNPLFLYGGVGVGKTHLMQAVAHEVLKKNPRLKVICCTGEEFTNEIVNAIRKKTTQEFKQKFRTTKLLMVDDIQFIAGKDRAQEEFFHTFNSVWRAGGQIILTSDRRPEEISKLEDRLRSRFEGGLTIDIQPPDFELRTAILLIKAQQRKFNLPMDIAQLIASNITSTRKLEGFLTRIMTEAITRKEPLTVELVSAIIGKSNGAVISQRLVKPKEVISAVANHFEIKIADLTGERRQKIIVVPRQVLMYLLRTELKIQLVEIGRLLGGRDHSTIIHGVEKITHSLPTSEQLRVDIAGIKQRLYGPI